MIEVLAFMGNNPWLTFFLVLIAAQMVVGVAKAFAVAVRGWPPRKMKKSEDECSKKECR